MDILSSVLIAAGLTITDPITSTYPTASGAPFSVTSNVMNPNLNADRVDDYHAGALLSRVNHTGSQAISTITGLQSALDLNANRWISGFTTLADLRDATSGGVKYWTESTANRPEGYGTVLTFVGISNTGNSGDGSWINQLMSGTSGSWYVRRGSGTATGATWQDTYKLWSTQHFSQIDIDSWNYQITAISLKEDKFLKGNLIQGTGVTLTGVLTNRLVGSGDITFAAASTVDLSDYVSKTTANTISAYHNFSGELQFGGQNFRYLYGTAAYEHFYPRGGNGSVTTTAALRVWDGPNNTLRQLQFDGNGNFSWDNEVIATRNWVFANDKFVTGFGAIPDFNLITKGGVKYFTESTLNRPENYGTVLSFAGVSGTGDLIEGGWMHQLISGTSGDWYLRFGSGTSGNPIYGPTYKIWTQKQFSQTDINNWNTSFSALASKENAFSKGSLLPGVNVTFSGASLNRLVGAGDLTINVSAAGNAFTNNGVVGAVPMYDTITSITASPLTINTTSGLLNFGNRNFQIGQTNDYKVKFSTSLNATELKFTNVDGSTAYTFLRFNDNFVLTRTGIGGGPGVTFNMLEMLANGSLALYAGAVAPLTVSSQVLNVNLNADLLDGYHASSLLDRANHTGAFVLSASYTNNPNGIPGIGFYYADNVTTNTPAPYAAFLEIKRGTNGRSQLAFDTVNSSGALWVRSQGNSGVFSSWYQVMTTATFGTVSNTAAQGNDSRIINGQAAFDQLPYKMPSDRQITINGTVKNILDNPVFTISGGSGIPTDRTITINGLSKYLNDSPVFTVSTGGSGGTVTQVGLSAPAGFYVTSAPITTSGNVAFQWAAGYEPLQSNWIEIWNAKMLNDRTLSVNGNTFLLRNNVDLGTFLTSYDLAGYAKNERTITINGNTQIIGGNPVFTIAGGGGGMAIDRTITINGNTQFVNNNPSFTIAGGGSGMPVDRTITINGNTQYVNNNPSFTVSGGGGGGVTGSGSNRRLPRWSSDGSNLTDSLLIQADLFGVAQFVMGSTSVRADLVVQGLVIPGGYTVSQRNALPFVYEGAIVYQTDGVKGWYGNNGSTWVRLG